MASAEDIIPSDVQFNKLQRPPPSKLVAPLPDYIRIKILSLGATSSGKSCLIKRFCEERFVPKYISTIGVDYGVKVVSVANKEVKVDFWDLAGQLEYFEIRNEFYKDTHGVILVYDVNTKKTFEQMESLLKEGDKFGLGNPVVLVCANKVDLKKRAVSEKEGQEWAAQRGYLYYETSASVGTNVKEAFMHLFRSVLESIAEKDDK